MAFCEQCGIQLRANARFCDKCGAPVEHEEFQGKPEQEGLADKSLLGWLLLVIGLIALMSLLQRTSTSNPEQDEFRRRVSEAAEAAKKLMREEAVRYAHTAINVRAGRSTNSEVSGMLNRGDTVEIDSSENGWVLVHRNGRRLGYIYEKLLKVEPIPPFEIVSWNWYTDPSFGTDGSVIWNVQIRNNTNQYISSVRVEFTTYDAAGNIIESDFTYVSGLSPNAISSAKSYTTYFGRERKARIRIDQSSIH